MTGLVLLEELQLENNLLGFVDPSAETIIDRVKTIVTANSNIKALASLNSLSTLNLKNNKLVNPPELIMSALPNLSVKHSKKTSLKTYRKSTCLLIISN